MDFKHQLGKNIISLLLFVALMLPTVIEFNHVFEDHNYVDCKEQKTHMHESVIKCEICSFNFESFSFNTPEVVDLILPDNPVLSNVKLAPQKFHSFKLTNTQLRAPPIYS